MRCRGGKSGGNSLIPPTLRKGLALLILALALPACDEGNSDSGTGSSYVYGSMTIDLSIPTTTHESYIFLGGNLYRFDNPPGTHVSWINSTTGSAGSGGDWMYEETYWFLGYTWTELVHKWGANVPLQWGPNSITVTVTDDAGRLATETIVITYEPALPTVRILQPWSGPSWFTLESPLELSGTASDGPGLDRIEWSNDLTAAAGIAWGTTAWNVSVPLGPGTNGLHITAVDVLGRTASATISVTYPAENPPPTLTVTSPEITGTYITAEAGLLIAGTASTPFGIDHYEFLCVETNVGSTSSGGLMWSFWATLAPGSNTIRITAVDALGHSTTLTLSIVRISS